MALGHGTTLYIEVIQEDKTSTMSWRSSPPQSYTMHSCRSAPSA